MKNKVAIVIPTHKAEFNELEMISLDRALKVFEHYDIYFALPETLKCFVPDGIKIQRFDDLWFSSFEMYNKMMVTKEFYERFVDYEYILIYQLDAFVFEDKLEYFCNLGYDYIGAPWLYGVFNYVSYDKAIWHVGNGGLSLRKVDSAISLLEKKRDIELCGEYDIFLEDVFWASCNENSFKIASIDIALQFSFEGNVRECFERNQCKLPFGCHAWEKWDLVFWKEYIENCGYSIPLKYLSMGRQDDKKEVIEARKKRIHFWEHIFDKTQFSNYFKGKFVSQEDKVVIWGAGYWGRVLHQILVDAGVLVDAFIDKKGGKHIKRRKECPVITWEEYVKSDLHTNIVVAIWDVDVKIEDALKQRGYVYKKDYIFIRDLDMLVSNIQE